MISDPRHILNVAGLAYTHWGRRIIQAQDNGRFTEGDRRRAEDWTTCACGKLNDGIPRQKSGRPADAQLRYAGQRFETFVKRDFYASAARTLVEIEDRAVEVLVNQTFNRD